MKSLPSDQLEHMREKALAIIIDSLKQLRSARYEANFSYLYGGSIYTIISLYNLGLLGLDEYLRLSDLASSAVSYARRAARHA